jgi:DNA-binding transcriptional LysR family regulator
LRQIEAFRAAATLRTATAAAQSLGLTQPAVSRLISDLERTVGFVLFERRARGLVLTIDGEHLLAAVDRSFSGLDMIADAAVAIKRHATGMVRIVSMAVYSDGFVADAIGFFLAENPLMRVESAVASMPEILHGLSLEEFDLGVGTIPIGSEAIDARQIGRREAVLVFPPGTAPAHAGWDVFERPFLAMPQDNPFRASFDAAMTAAGIKPRIACEFRNQRAACRACLAGAGIAMVEAATAAEFAHLGLEARPFPGGLDWPVAILVPRRRELSAAAIRLSELLEKSI